jgi:hypothetical protein
MLDLGYMEGPESRFGGKFAPLFFASRRPVTRSWNEKMATLFLLQAMFRGRVINVTVYIAAVIPVRPNSGYQQVETIRFSC